MTHMRAQHTRMNAHTNERRMLKRHNNMRQHMIERQQY